MADSFAECAVGIVGAGQMAVEAHLPVLLAFPGLRVSWIVDRNDSKAAMISRAIGIKAVPLPGDLTQLPEADIVLLAVPYGARPPFYESLSASGVAIYVEKPFALSNEEHHRLCRMFLPYQLGCGFQRRSSGLTRRLRDTIEAELFGRLLSIRVEFGGPGTRGGTYQSNLVLAGGGLLFDVAVHALDEALFVVGATDVTVTAVNMVREQGFDIHTTASAIVRAGSGRPVNLELLVSTLEFTAMSTVYRFEHASVTHEYVGDGAMWVTPRTGVEQRLKLKLVSPDGEYPRTPAQLLNEQWAQFLGAVSARTPNYTCASATAVTSSLIGQLYRA